LPRRERYRNGGAGILKSRSNGDLSAGAQFAIGCTKVAVLTRLRRAVAGQPEARDIARAVNTALAPVLRAPIWLMSVYNADTHSATVVWQIHAGKELPGGSFPLGDGVTSRVLRSASSMLIRQWSSEGPAVRVQYPTPGTPGLPESSVTVPIVFAREVLGVLAVQHYRPGAFDETDVRLLEAAARVVAPALRDARGETDHLACPLPVQDKSEMAANEAQLIRDGDGAESEQAPMLRAQGAKLA
jgi:GAF domain-containing protein